MHNDLLTISQSFFTYQYSSNDLSMFDFATFPEEVEEEEGVAE